MSIKVAPGQLSLWEMAADMSRADKSMAATAFRDYVAQVAKQQAIAPDVVPDKVNVSNQIDSTTGKLAKYTA